MHVPSCKSSTCICVWCLSFTQHHERKFTLQSTISFQKLFRRTDIRLACPHPVFMQLIITEKCHNLHLYQVHYFCYFFPASFPNTPCSFYLLSVLSVSNAQGLKPKITNAALGKLTSVSWLFPGVKKTDCPITSLMHSVTFSFCQMQKNIKMWLSIIKKKKWSFSAGR